MNRDVDLEWVELIKEAIEAGISKEQIREYLQNHPCDSGIEHKVL
ncbi:anti-repressor SinI family protein [Bacillus sp. KH172YL63]|nr:anti-repressor SinI family protein [Bacillus sp. KH172YL63]